MKLNEDDREIMAEFVTHPGWEVFMKVLENMVKDRANKIIRYNVSQGKAEELVRLKHLYDGSESLLLDIKGIKSKS